MPIWLHTGTVESLAGIYLMILATRPPSTASRRVTGEVYPARAFITFSGPQGHEDSLEALDQCARMFLEYMNQFQPEPQPHA